MSASDPSRTYELLDCGDGRRLERFGHVIVDRPAPAADFPRALPARARERAALRFDRNAGWRGAPPEDWRVAFGPAVLSLAPSAGGQIGVFPEHASVADRLDEVLSRLRPPADGRRCLNLFAHTGLATLRLAARDDVAVTVHVDAAPAAVRRARENAAGSGLAERRIRWLVDDVMGFLARERRRQNRYEVIVADPPAFGRRRGAGEWNLRKDLPELLEAAAALLPEKGGVVCLTGHSGGLDGRAPARLLAEALPQTMETERFELEISPSSGGRPLPAGWAVLATDGRRT